MDIFITSIYLHYLVFQCHIRLLKTGDLSSVSHFMSNVNWDRLHFPYNLESISSKGNGGMRAIIYPHPDFSHSPGSRYTCAFPFSSAGTSGRENPTPIFFPHPSPNTLLSIKPDLFISKRRQQPISIFHKQMKDWIWRRASKWPWRGRGDQWKDSSLRRCLPIPAPHRIMPLPISPSEHRPACCSLSGLIR